MPNARTAQTVFTEMRRLYESGLKSANKSYDTVHASWWKRVSGKAERRNQAQKAAAWALGAVRTDTQGLDVLNTGAYLMQAGVPVANCGELGSLACYLATSAGVPRTELALGSVVTPNRAGDQRGADHAFARYGDAQVLGQMANMAVTLQGIGNARAMFRDQVYAIDAWANIWCSLDEYPAKVASKMRSWSSDGKRVLWVYNNNNPPDWEWSTPGGDYARVFAAASLQVIRC
jgi:hypothetical protein